MHNAGFEDIPFKFHYSGNYNVIIKDDPKVSIFIYSPLFLLCDGSKL